MHGVVSTEEGVTHHEEISSVLSEGNSAETSTDILTGEFDNVISGLHLKPDILLLIIKGSRHQESYGFELLSLVTEEGEGTILD